MITLQLEAKDLARIIDAIEYSNEQVQTSHISVYDGEEDTDAQLEIAQRMKKLRCTLLDIYYKNK